MDGIIRIGVTFLCHDGNGNYLLHWRSKGARDEHERWDYGGGGLKFGEQIVEAMHRELKEEYGTQAISFKPTGWRDIFRTMNGKDTHWVQFDFIIHIDRATAIVGEPHKNGGLRWVTKEELFNMQEPVHSMFNSFLEKNKAFIL